jgi:hypothetical protein
LDGAVRSVGGRGLAASGGVGRGRDGGGRVGRAMIAGQSGSGSETAVLIRSIEVGLEKETGMVLLPSGRQRHSQQATSNRPVA